MVQPREGGPYSLFCPNCKVLVPNTANNEMKKEGFFAHSHQCGVKSPDEISEEEWKERMMKR